MSFAQALTSSYAMPPQITLPSDSLSPALPLASRSLPCLPKLPTGTLTLTNTHQSLSLFANCLSHIRRKQGADE